MEFVGARPHGPPRFPAAPVKIAFYQDTSFFLLPSCGVAFFSCYIEFADVVTLNDVHHISGKKIVCLKTLSFADLLFPNAVPNFCVFFLAVSIHLSKCIVFSFISSCFNICFVSVAELQFSWLVSHCRLLILLYCCIVHLSENCHVCVLKFTVFCLNLSSFEDFHIAVIISERFDYG